jgi:hypothetical protein
VFALWRPRRRTPHGLIWLSCPDAKNRIEQRRRLLQITTRF